jgi:hypothetical protein
VGGDARSCGHEQVLFLQATSNPSADVEEETCSPEIQNDFSSIAGHSAEQRIVLSMSRTTLSCEDLANHMPIFFAFPNPMLTSVKAFPGDPGAGQCLSDIVQHTRRTNKTCHGSRLQSDQIYMARPSRISMTYALSSGHVGQ